jgi:flagellar biosynthesis protein FliQ
MDRQQFLTEIIWLTDEIAILAVFAIVLLQGDWITGTLHDHTRNLPE